MGTHQHTGHRITQAHTHTDTYPRHAQSEPQSDTGPQGHSRHTGHADAGTHRHNDTCTHIHGTHTLSQVTVSSPSPLELNPHWDRHAHPDTHTSYIFGPDCVVPPPPYLPVLAQGTLPQKGSTEKKWHPWSSTSFPSEPLPPANLSLSTRAQNSQGVANGVPQPNLLLLPFPSPRPASFTHPLSLCPLSMFFPLSICSLFFLVLFFECLFHCSAPTSSFFWFSSVPLLILLCHFPFPILTSHRPTSLCLSVLVSVLCTVAVCALSFCRSPTQHIARFFCQWIFPLTASSTFCSASQLPWLIFTSLSLFLVTPCSIWDLCSPTRDWTHAPCIGRQNLDHWTARQVPGSIYMLMPIF